MENKCCEYDTCGGNVYINMNKCCGDGGDVVPCTCIPSLKITIGDGGEFATLTEALEHARTIVHNTLEIEMLSDVVETRTGAIWINGFEMPSSLILKGNGHTLNLNSITDQSALGFYAGGKGWIDNVTILAQSITMSVIRVGTDAFSYIRQDVKIVGSPSKTTVGIDLYWGGRLNISYGNNILENFKYGIKAHSSSTACFKAQTLTFTNVTTNCYPAQNTVGNGNAYIHVE